MKVSELLQEETLEQYTKRLVRTLKIEKLGSGVYATVFQHPVYHNVAVKIVEDDPEYVRYARFCQANPTNRWLPKVVDIVKIKVDENNWGGTSKTPITIVFFQKLRKVKLKEYHQAAKDILATLPPDVDTRLDKDVTLPPPTLEDFGIWIWDALAKHSSDKDLRIVAKFLKRYQERLGGDNDLHRNNVMMRDEGDKSQLVFTDPVVS